MKQCVTCKQWKPLDDFHKNKASKDGRSPRCKECAKAATAQWRLANPLRALEAVKKWHKENVERVREIKRDWEARNPEKYQESLKRYRASDKRKVVSSKYASTHREQKRKNWQNYRARKAGNGGKITTEEWQALKQTYDYMCLSCGRREPEIELTIDHVVPIVAGGKHAISNAQPLCQGCNSRKGTKTTDYRIYYGANAAV